MPYVNIRLTPAIDREKKRELVSEVTGTLVRLLGKSPEHIHIVIDEVAEENWGFAGMLTDEFRKSRNSPG